MDVIKYDLDLDVPSTGGYLSSEQIESYRRKGVKLDEVSDVIRESDVRLDGVTYWTITDKFDHNLERIRTDLYTDGKSVAASSLETVCSGRICKNDSSYSKDNDKTIN